MQHAALRRKRLGTDFRFKTFADSGFRWMFKVDEGGGEIHCSLKYHSGGDIARDGV